MGVSAAVAIVGGVMASQQHDAQRAQLVHNRNVVKAGEKQFADQQQAAENAEVKDVALKANAEGIRRQRALKGETSGRAGTILTAPLATPAVPAAGAVPGQKTLLGT